MKIGIPKEIKAQENRVGMTPNGVLELIKKGHIILVETNAGLGSGFTNEEYEKVGAIVSNDLAKVWSQEMVIKVKEPLESEYKYFYENQIIFTYFHLAGLKELTQELMKKKVIAIDYETVQTQDRLLPLLRPMSEVAGRMAILIASNLSFKTNNGMGILSSGTPGTPKANITIIGGGIAGTNAAKMAMGIDANVILVEQNENRIRELYNIFGGKIAILKSTHENIFKVVKDSDVVISTVLIPGKKL